MENVCNQEAKLIRPEVKVTVFNCYFALRPGHNLRTARQSFNLYTNCSYQKNLQGLDYFKNQSIWKT